MDSPFTEESLFSMLRIIKELVLLPSNQCRVTTNPLKTNQKAIEGGISLDYSETLSSSPQRV